MLFILVRRYIIILFEQVVEMREGIISYLHGYLQNRHVCCGEQVRCISHARFGKVFHNGLSRYLFVQPTDVFVGKHHVLFKRRQALLNNVRFGEQRKKGVEPRGGGGNFPV